MKEIKQEKNPFVKVSNKLQRANIRKRFLLHKVQEHRDKIKEIDKTMQELIAAKKALGSTIHEYTEEISQLKKTIPGLETTKKQFIKYGEPNAPTKNQKYKEILEQINMENFMESFRAKK